MQLLSLRFGLAIIRDGLPATPWGIAMGAREWKFGKDTLPITIMSGVQMTLQLGGPGAPALTRIVPLSNTINQAGMSITALFIWKTWATPVARWGITGWISPLDGGKTAPPRTRTTVTAPESPVRDFAIRPAQTLVRTPSVSADNGVATQDRKLGEG